MEILFIIGMIIGQHCGYTIRVEMRGERPIPQTSLERAITTLTFPSWISLFIWGFINLKWYLVIGIFLVCALIITPIVFNKFPLATIFRFKIISESILLILGILVWSSYIL